MEETRRYRLRPGAVALTGPEWVFVTVFGVIGVVGAVLLLSNMLLGALMLAGAGGAMGLTIITRGRFGSPSS